MDGRLRQIQNVSKGVEAGERTDMGREEECLQEGVGSLRGDPDCESTGHPGAKGRVRGWWVVVSDRLQFTEELRFLKVELCGLEGVGQRTQGMQGIN